MPKGGQQGGGTQGGKQEPGKGEQGGELLDVAKYAENLRKTQAAERERTGEDKPEGS